MDVDFVYFVDMYQGRPAESFAGGGGKTIVTCCCTIFGGAKSL